METLELLCICGARLKENDKYLCHHCVKDANKENENDPRTHPLPLQLWSQLRRLF